MSGGQRKVKNMCGGQREVKGMSGGQRGQRYEWRSERGQLYEWRSERGQLYEWRSERGQGMGESQKEVNDVLEKMHKDCFHGIWLEGVRYGRCEVWKV